MEVDTKFAIVALVLAAAIVNNEPMMANGLTPWSMCGVAEERLMSCKPSVTLTNPVPPSAACCSAISGADLSCLCSKKSLLAALGLDPNQATQLPAKCNIKTTVRC
ncbi:hypothetical protein L1049_015865 [Liquidambar formosana]|uniref:Bifunctional inhibitor/plant lipid transfer protein/seed storage helical domain-containing protein n=1 Tax=Liquidambar formosana TaxID=63359 RepID=A0AAP0RZP0_LIQFO